MITKNTFPQNFNVYVPIKTSNSVCLQAEQIIYNIGNDTFENKNICLIVTLEIKNWCSIEEVKNYIKILTYDHNIQDKTTNMLTLICCFINTVLDATDRFFTTQDYNKLVICNLIAYDIIINIISDKTEFDLETQLFFKMEQKIINSLIYYKNLFSILEYPTVINNVLTNKHFRKRLMHKLLGKTDVKLVFAESIKEKFPYVFNVAQKNNYHALTLENLKNLTRITSTTKDYYLTNFTITDLTTFLCSSTKLQKIACYICLLNTLFKNYEEEKKDTLLTYTCLITTKLLRDLCLLLPKSAANDAFWENIVIQQFKTKLFSFLHSLCLLPKNYSVILKNTDYWDNKQFKQYILDYSNYFFNLTKNNKNTTYWEQFPEEYKAYVNAKKIKTKFKEEKIKETPKLNPYKQARKKYKKET